MKIPPHAIKTARFSAASPIVNVMIDAVQKASRGLLRDFGELEHLQVSRKGLGDFVSVADKRSESFLIETLQKARPSYGFLTEESGEIPGEDPSHCWIIDPLDGTNNFLHGYPYFCITVALKRDNVIVAGVTYDPLKDEIFYAEKGCGAFLNNRRIRVTQRKKLEETLVAVGFAHVAEFDYVVMQTGLANLSRHGVSIRTAGASALDLAYIASGRLDGACFWGLKPWDVAAGILMIHEAGGIVTDFEGQQDILTPGNIITANPGIYKNLRDCLALVD